MFKHSLRLFLFLAAFLPLAGCERAKAPQAVLPSVSYMEVKTQALTLTTELPGRTSAYMIAEVRPQVSGIIQERLFVEGSDVKEGDVLYQIDPALYQAAYDNAKAALLRAEANEVAARLLAERYRKVVGVSAVSKQEYDNAVAAYGQASADVAAARAALDSARINLEYTRVTAPVSGRIGRSAVTPGALVIQNQSTPLATVQQLDPMYVDVTQSSVELLRLRRAFKSGQLRSSGETAMQATLKLEDGTTYMRRVPKSDSGGEKTAKGADGGAQPATEPVIGLLKFSEVTVEQSTGAVTIRAMFPNPEGILLPGMYVRAVLEEGVSENAILIPQKAVVRNNRGLPLVQKLTKNATIQNQEGVYNITPQAITVDRPIDNQWLVTDGLEAGDLIMLEGLMRVRPGMAVKGVAETGTPGASPATSAR